MVEQAIAREALRLAFIQHKSFAVGLKGVQQQRTVSDTFDQKATGQTLVDLMSLSMLVGSGGVLSHAPRRQQATFMLIDAFLPEGTTQLAVDSIFMMPQLGVLATVHKQAATEVFDKDCLIRLGTCIAPVGLGKPGKPCMKISVEVPGGQSVEREVNYGELFVIPAPYGEPIAVKIEPSRGFDAGAGKGKDLETDVPGGVSGVIVDARGRQPFQLPADKAERVEKLQEWNKAMDAYPE
jgi:hypothetical protein